MSSDPWNVQLEYHVREAVHHDVLEDVEARLRADPQGFARADVAQGEVHSHQPLVLVNATVAVADPVEAGRHARVVAERHLPAHEGVYRLTVWRPRL